MNKITKENVQTEANKVKMCLMGQVNTDTQGRLPAKPEELNDWEKFKLIESGAAKVDKSITMRRVMSRYGTMELIESFTYPVSDAQKAYSAAKKKTEDEKQKRELAVENAVRHVVSKELLEVISTADYLKELDNLASQKW